MGKKILLTICSLLAAPAFADETAAGDIFGSGSGLDGGLYSNTGDSMSFGGDRDVVSQLKAQGLNFYIGGGLGVGMLNATMTATEGYTSGVPQPLKGHKAKIKSKLPGIAFQFGAQKKGQVLTDFGMMAMYSPMTITQKTPGGGGTFTDKNTLKQKYSFSVYGGAGVPLTPSVNVFGKLGLVYTSFVLGYQQVGSTHTGSETKGVVGVAPGFMVQYKMSDTLSTNLDVSYAVYQSITTGNLAKSPTGYNYKIKTSPRILTIMLGGTITLGGGK